MLLASVGSSILLVSTKISRRPIIGLIVRPFKSENASSNLVGVTKLFKKVVDNGIVICYNKTIESDAFYSLTLLNI